jgi:hypothetical protein
MLIIAPEILMPRLDELMLQCFVELKNLNGLIKLRKHKVEVNSAEFNIYKISQ